MLSYPHWYSPEFVLRASLSVAILCLLSGCWGICWGVVRSTVILVWKLPELMPMAPCWQGLCRTSLLTLWSLVSQVWQVVCYHPAHCWKKKETVIWVPSASQRANPLLAQSNTKICCPKGCKREVEGAVRPSHLPSSARKQQYSRLWDSSILPAFSVTTRQQPLSVVSAKVVCSLRLSWGAEGRRLRGGKRSEKSPVPCPASLLSLVSQLFVSQRAL